MEYTEDDFLQISGLQHYCFCKRQWALIHIEQQWAENLRTVEGNIMHENAHNPFFAEKRGDVITVRELRVFSPILGLSGNCDIVEFRQNKNGIKLNNYEGTYIPYPV